MRTKPLDTNLPYAVSGGPESLARFRGSYAKTDAANHGVTAPSADSDEALWVAFQNGDDAAYTVLYHRFAGRLYAYLKVLLATSPEIVKLDDIFQETWIKLFHARETLVLRGPRSFSGWIYRVCHNQAYAEMRKPQMSTNIDEVLLDRSNIDVLSIDPEESAHGIPELEFLMAKVLEEVEKLPLILREVFILTELNRLTLEEAATALNISRTNAKVRLFRARKMLREELEGLIDV